MSGTGISSDQILSTPGEFAPHDSLLEVMARSGQLREPLKETLAASAMHRLCQPLTALLCTLELGMEFDAVEDLKASMRDSLRECLRAIAMVTAFRDLLQQGTRYAAEKGAINARVLATVHGLRWVPTEGADGSGAARVGSTEAQIAADPAGVDHILRQVLKALTACGATLSSAGGPGASFETGSGPGQLGVVAWAGARQEGVEFIWRLSTRDNVAWLRECELAQPFEARDFDFTRSALPRLAVARIVVEAMGGWFRCGPDGVEILFPRVSTPQ